MSYLYKFSKNVYLVISLQQIDYFQTYCLLLQFNKEQEKLKDVLGPQTESFKLAVKKKIKIILNFQI